MDAGNDRFNLMILCWGEGHASPIHDHADSHCFMKMLKGELCEIRYAWPTDTDNNNEYGGEMIEISRSIMETNSVRYINGKFYLKIKYHFLWYCLNSVSFFICFKIIFIIHLFNISLK